MEARALHAPLRAAPEGGGTAYRQLASDLRHAITAGRYPAGRRLPTEAELVACTGFHPDRYSYRLQLRGRVDHTAGDRAAGRNASDSLPYLRLRLFPTRPGT